MTAARRTLLILDHQVTQTGLHKLTRYQQLPSHHRRREEHLLHHVYHRQSVTCGIMNIYSISTSFTERGLCPVHDAGNRAHAWSSAFRSQSSPCNWWISLRRLSIRSCMLLHAVEATTVTFPSTVCRIVRYGQTVSAAVHEEHTTCERILRDRARGLLRPFPNPVPTFASPVPIFPMPTGCCLLRAAHPSLLPSPSPYLLPG